MRQPQNPLQLQAVIKALLTMSPDEGGLVSSFRTSRLPGRLRPGAAPGLWTASSAAHPPSPEIVNRQKAVTIVYGK